jgi:hypothetical protein
MARRGARYTSLDAFLQSNKRHRVECLYDFAAPTPITDLS